MTWAVLGTIYAMTGTSTTGEDPASTAAAYARARRTLWIVFGVAIGLLATHVGEFWPFSIYPMFSRAGRPFHRAIVRELGDGEALPLEPRALSDLPGEPFPLVPAGVDYNDVATMVAKTELWTEERSMAMYRAFSDHAAHRRLVVYAARGDRVDGTVAVTYRPVIELSKVGPKPLAE